jgi:hypothetical protein
MTSVNEVTPESPGHSSSADEADTRMMIFLSELSATPAPSRGNG